MLHVSLFGGVSCRVDDRPLPLLTAKTRVLLAWLLEHAGVAQPRRVLAELFWPEHDVRDGLHNVRMALGFLRPLLAAAPGMLTVTAQTITFVPNDLLVVDTVVFGREGAACSAHRHRALERCPVCAQRLRNSLEWYVGAFLHGEKLDVAAQVVSWVEMSRARYARQAAESRW